MDDPRFMHPMLKSLSGLYHDMDQAWHQTAAAYGFQCSGCEDNCCRSLFFHHTHIEKAYLLSGFDDLDQETQKDILDRAAEYCRRIFSDEGPVQGLKLMCPINANGLCRLYRCRPMICRLHGLPHEVRIPGKPIVMGQGCAAGGFEDRPYLTFDRTPFYQRMALLETDFRRLYQKTKRIRETIAQMLISGKTAEGIMP